MMASVSLSFAQVSNSPVITNLNSAGFNTAIAEDKNAVIIDLRTTDEINNKGYIKGSLQLDFLAKDSEKQIDKLDKNKTYYVYCAAGGRSGDAAEYMEKHGFKRVYNLEKGFSDWASKGMPVEKK
jgi:phage shock protein E